MWSNQVTGFRLQCIEGAICTAMAACLLGVLLLAPATTAAAVYRYIDKQGRVYFTDKPEHSGYRKLVQTWKGWREPSFDARQFRANQRRFAPLLAEIAREQRLPDALVHAVVTAESAYDPDALSSASKIAAQLSSKSSVCRVCASATRSGSPSSPLAFSLSVVIPPARHGRSLC